VGVTLNKEGESKEHRAESRTAENASEEQQRMGTELL